MNLPQGAHHAPAAGFGSCDDLSGTLTSLATQVGDLAARLAGTTGQVRWTGPAAAAFHSHAAARYGTLAELVKELAESADVAHGLQCLVAEGAAGQPR